MAGPGLNKCREGQKDTPERPERCAFSTPLPFPSSPLRQKPSAKATQSPLHHINPICYSSFHFIKFCTLPQRRRQKYELAFPEPQPPPHSSQRNTHTRVTSPLRISGEEGWVEQSRSANAETPKASRRNFGPGPTFTVRRVRAVFSKCQRQAAMPTPSRRGLHASTSHKQPHLAHNNAGD